jgi:hypothetical protein
MAALMLLCRSVSLLSWGRGTAGTTWGGHHRAGSSLASGTGSEGYPSFQVFVTCTTTPFWDSSRVSSYIQGQ